MKEVIRSVLASKDSRSEEALRALVAKSAQAGYPWAGIEA